VGAKLSVDVSTGKTSANTSTSSRAFSESLADANSWDVLRYRMYLDNAYGVYVFDVDSAQSWTSLPYETGYSRPSVDWRVHPDHDSLVAEPGQTAGFEVTVRNANRTGVAALDTIQSVQVSVSRNSGASVNVDPVELQSPRGADRLVHVTASATDTGLYHIVVKLQGSISNGVNSSTPLVQNLPLFLRVRGSSVGIRPSSPSYRPLARSGTGLLVSAPAGEAWRLDVLTLDGRVVEHRTGTGPLAVRLPAGLVGIARLATGTGTSHLVWNNLR
jgi:hypothetical protein